MLKPALLYLAIAATVVCALPEQNRANAGKNGQVILRWLGTAGWEISDGSTVILIDPYLSRINGPRPPGAGSAGTPLDGDTRHLYGWDDPAEPDKAVIDAHIPRANFILVTHTHYDHVLDVPYIAAKTHAVVIGTESTENVVRPYGVPEEQLITVRGGEDYEFGTFSVKVIPSIHSALDHKHYYSSEKAPSDMKAPLTLKQIALREALLHSWFASAGIRFSRLVG